MPGFDGTGPAGGGPMTGRGVGCCARRDYPMYPQAGGMGRGAAATSAVRDYGCGRGRGYGWMYHATGVPGCMRSEVSTRAAAEPQADNSEEEILVLRQQANRLRSQLDAIEERLGNLAGQKPESGE